MTQADIQKVVAVRHNGDIAAPATTSDDWSITQTLANEAISLWEKDSEWKELITDLTSAGTGTKTTTAGVEIYTAPTDLIRTISYLTITDAAGSPSYYEQIKPSERFRYSGAKVFWVTGKPGAYAVHIGSTAPATSSLTINYDYLKTSLQFTGGTDVPDMADPYFIVSYVLWRLYDLDGDDIHAAENKTDAFGRLAKMRENNELMGADQPNRVVDSDFAQGSGGFGV